MAINKNSKTYNSNPNLKRTYVPISFTPHQVREIQKCMEDPYYFFDNYYFVKNADGDELPFHPYPYQKEMLDTILGNRFVICRMSRQSRKVNPCGCIHALDNFVSFQQRRFAYEQNRKRRHSTFSTY